MEKMIFVLTSELKDALSLLLKTATTKSSGSNLPEGVEIKKDTLAAISPSLIVSYKLTSDELGIAPQLFETPIIIPPKGISVILDSNEGTEITMIVEENLLSIKKGTTRGVAKITISPDNEFPPIDPVDVNKVDNIEVDDFLNAIKCTRHAISDNMAKPIYTGIHLMSDGKELSFFAVDGYKAALWKQKYESDEFVLSIPDSAINALMAALSKSSGELSVVRCKNNRKAAFIVGGKMVIRTHLLDGQIIDLTKAIFNTDAKSFVINKKEALSSLKTIGMLEDKLVVHPLVLNVSNEFLTILYRGASAEYLDEIRISEHDCKESTVIGMNNRFFQDAISALPSDKVSVKYVNSSTPVVFSATFGEKEIYQLVVPMRIDKKS